MLLRRVLSVLAVAILVAGCSGQTTSSNSVSVGPSSVGSSAEATSVEPSLSSAPLPTGTVTWWTDIPDDAIAKLEPLFTKPLEEKYPGLTVEFVSKGDALQDALRTAVQGGAGPDIIALPGPSYLSPYTTANLLEPLDEAAAAYHWSDFIAPWALNAGKVQGALYALPENYDVVGVMYNKEVFADNGLTFPSNMTELQDVGEKLMAKGIAPFANGAHYITFFSSPFLGSISGSDTVYQALTGQIPWNDPKLMVTMQQLNDWIQKGWFRGSKDAFLAGEEFGGYSLLASKKAAMYVIGAWAFDNMTKAFAGHEDDWAWAQLPALGPGVTADYPIGVGGTLSINAASKNKDAAAAVLDFVYSDPHRAGAIIGVPELSGNWNVPITTLQASDFPSTMDPRQAAEIADVSKAVASGDYGYLAWSFQGPKQNSVYEDDFPTVVQGGMSLDDWGAKLGAAYEEEVASGVQPPVPQR